MTPTGNQLTILEYRNAIDIDPGYADAYNNVGTMFARQGDIEQAISNYQKALTLDSKHRDARRNLDRAFGDGRS